jgi:hypothetical protein
MDLFTYSDGAVKDGMILEPQTVMVIIDNAFSSLK